MDELIERLEIWFQSHLPAALTRRPPGVTEADLVAAEAAMGQRLPDDVRALYRWQNGAQCWEYAADQQGSVGAFWNGFADGWFMPLARVVEEHGWSRSDQSARRLVDQRLWWWRETWVAVIRRERSRICVDTAGAWGGRPGQLVEYWNNDPVRPILAPSLTDWFAARLADLEAGAPLDASGHLAEDPKWSDPEGYPLYGNLEAPPDEAAADDEPGTEAGPSDLAVRAENARPADPNAPKTRLLLTSTPRWGRFRGRWYIVWRELDHAGARQMMSFIPDTSELWATAKRITDAAAAANWEYDTTNPHWPAVAIEI